MEKVYKRNIGIVLLLAIFLRGICYLQNVHFEFRSDDFGPLVYPAYLAGYDWSTFISGVGNYYGYGYYWIFAPLFRLITNPERLIQLMAAIHSVLIAGSSGFIYALLVKYFNMPNSRLTVALALVPTLFVGDTFQTNRFWYRTDNEIPLYFVCWLLVWIILKAWTAKNTHQKEGGLGTEVRLAVSGAIVLIWSLMIHERALALVLAVMAMEVIWRLLKKEWLFQPIAFFSTVAVGYVLQRLLRTYVISLFWSADDTLKNTSTLSSVSLWFTESYTGLKSVLIVFFGNWHSALMKSYGFVSIAIVILVMWLVKQCALLRKRKHIPDGRKTEENIYMDLAVFIMSVFSICIFIIISGLGLRWGAKLYDGLLTDEVVYAYKGICYSRYYYTFLGPVILMVAAYLYHSQKLFFRTVAAFWVVALVLEGIFVVLALPYCSKDITIWNRTLNLKLLSAGNLILSFVMMFGCMFLLSLFAVKKLQYAQKKTLLFTLVLIILLSNVALRIEKVKPLRDTFSFKSGIQMQQALESIEENDVDLPEVVYLKINNQGDLKFSLQILMPEQKFSHGLPDDLSNETILISQVSIKTLQQEGYYSTCIEDYYIYTNSDTYYRLLMDWKQEK